MTLVPQGASLQVTTVEDDPWWERALTDVTAFRNGLLEIGVPEEEVERDVQRWRQDIGPLSSIVAPSPPSPDWPPEALPPPPPGPPAGTGRRPSGPRPSRRPDDAACEPSEAEPPEPPPAPGPKVAGRDRLTQDYEEVRRQQEEDEVDRLRVLLEQEEHATRRVVVQNLPGGVLVDRKTALARLRDLLGQREYKVVAVERCPLRLPLFVLAAPPVPGSSVTYTQSVTAERSYGWAITALGSGTGNDRTVTAAASSSFAAADGDRQLIFLPAVIEVADVEVRRRGQVIGRGPRTQLISPAAGDIAHQACRPLGADELLGEPDPFAPSEQPFDLTDARPTDRPTIEESWKASSEMGISLGVTAFKLDLKCSVKIRRVREVKIGFVLPGGTTYRVTRLRNPEGLAWEIV